MQHMYTGNGFGTSHIYNYLKSVLVQLKCNIYYVNHED